MSDSTKKRLTGSPRHLILAGVFCLLLLSGLLAVQIARADGRILPNVSVGGVDVGGLAPNEAKARLEDALRALNVAGLEFRYGDRTLTVKANEKGAASPSESPVTYDIDGMVEAAFAFGHDAGTLSLLKANVRALFADVRQPALVIVDTKALHDLLVLRFGELEQPAKNATLTITSALIPISQDADATTTPAMRTVWNASVNPDSTGLTFDYDKAVDQAALGLGRWQGAAVALRAATMPPTIATADAEAKIDAVTSALNRGDATLAYDTLTWTIPQKTVAKALVLRKKTDGTVGVTLNHDVIEPFLNQAASAIESDPKPTHFTVDKNGRATDFIGGALGKRIDREESLARIDAQFETSENGVFPIAVTTVSSSQSDPIAQELGVAELLGYGTSSFSGSPKNRRANIANGAARLNGLIIDPGAEAGLLDELRPFDQSGGYLQELVIKDNRTVPEYGGGLCQIGTTTFRAVMNAGLPVTERQNHSYRVVYYEPAGTDATIYDPAPDFKFVNDTQNHVVLITKITGDTARFELWGTRDGRVEKQSPVKMTNVTPPPDPKLIETSALADGQKKCFESAHAGATTDFTYTVTYPDGTVKTKGFHSVYKPWQQQCLVGKTGAPHISLQKDGSLKEIPIASATTTAI